MVPVREAMACRTLVASGRSARRVTLPVTSSVSVSVPKAMVSSETLGSHSKCGSGRVAWPTSSTRRPVANGSSVPAWPIRRVWSARRAWFTTSCDVLPAGLSTSRMPSIGRPSARWRAVLVGRRSRVATALIVDLGEQRLDPRRVCNTLVQLERDLRRETKAKRTTDARPEMARDARETVERRRALRVAAENADEHFGVAKIASNVDTGNSHEADDARILYAFC